MGGTCSGSSRKDLPKKILIIGNSGGGKTLLLYSWVLGTNDLDTVPTDSFNVERVTLDGKVYMMWDLCGRKDFRLKRRQFYHGTDGVVYVIDTSSDIEDAIDDLTKVAVERDLNSIPFLVLINKRKDMNSDLVLKVESTLKYHPGSSQVMVVNIMNKESVTTALTQLDKMLTS
ncbi:uncharacterized protein LOC133202529 [Saccostrea echinata]|uniref:uncharacterized protein LOC133202529 n=1 Tax=Saccostrea echinata TaxID=191078 RepID=UPI002A83F372|nr:uncharacterized protein LOC133202529 [Saccostrea echinata]